MKKLWMPALFALCGFSCAPPSGGDYVAVSDDTAFGARNAAWEKDPCVDFTPEDCAGPELHCQCSQSDTWSLVDLNEHSEYKGQDLSPTSFGKVNLWAYYWAECGTCIQQLGYLQAVKDTLKQEGYEVEIVGVAYSGDVIGTLGTSPRDASGACRGRTNLPSCLSDDEIKLDIPVVAGGRAVAQTHEVERGDWFVYRADGKLQEFIRSEEREVRNGFLGDAPNWDHLISRLKAAVMAPHDGIQPCSSDYECTYDGQWCQFEQGRCGEDERGLHVLLAQHPPKA